MVLSKRLKKSSLNLGGGAMHNKNPLVSVLIPVYNVEKYLRQCLDSLVNQTLKEIEIICVNDGSTDESLSILQEYAKKDDRIVIINKQNGGLPSARNAGLIAASGKYVGFVDSDDYVDLDMFNILYDTAERKKAEITICGAQCFPHDEDVPLWMKESLSPEETFFCNSDLNVFFMQKGARPFIWRYLVKRELIETNKIRLDEAIVLGEDTALQFKLFSVAKRVAFVSKKLYHYRWTRQGSIMESLNYNDESKRISKHIDMIKSMWNNRFKEISTHYIVRFFEWAIDFIYWDIVRISFYQRIPLVKRFCDMLVAMGFYNQYTQYSQHTRDKFSYFQRIKKDRIEKPDVTFVLVLNGNDYFLDRCLRSILNQSYSNIEVLVYANGTNENCLKIMWRYFEKDQRIALRLGAWKPLCDHLNEALSIASGKYVVFVNGFNYYTDLTWISKSMTLLDENPDVDLVVNSDKEYALHDIKECQLVKYIVPMYRINVIRENALHFEDYSFLTGSVFFTKYCLKSKLAASIQQYVYQSEPLHRTSIYAEETKLLLRGMVWLLKAAKEYHLDALGRRVTEMLNSENYVRLITDSTYGFFVDESSLKNPKEDFHSEILSLLMEANKNAFLKEDEPALLRALSVFIDKRHYFLERF